VLAIGAHPDDIELGCGGALRAHVLAGDQVTMLVMTTGERGPQGLTSRIREQEAAAQVIGARLVWAGFEDGSVPIGREAVAVIDAVVAQTGADMIYTHSPNDSHQDHVATSQASLSAARRVGRVLYYQAPSTLAFDPTVFIDIGVTVEDKMAALQAHWSQVVDCPMVDLEAVHAGARYWGQRGRTRFAEAFEAPRYLVQIGPVLDDVDVAVTELSTEHPAPGSRDDSPTLLWQ
jgi:LmbE family N-acetylglucosaminyl deacetylase